MRKLGVQRDVRLGVVLNQFDLAAEHAAGSVELFDGQCRGLHHRLAVDIEVTGPVEHGAQFDLARLRTDDRRETADRGGCAASGQKLAAVNRRVACRLLASRLLGNRLLSTHMMSLPDTCGYAITEIKITAGRSLRPLQQAEG